MYSCGYSQVSKNSPQAQKRMQYRSKGKSCGYYMRIVFFFSSLIQSLIIVSLVLFLVYGKKQDSASTARIQDLEESFSRLSIENVALRQQRKNLTNLLNTTMTDKARNDWDLAKIRHYTNISSLIIQDYEKRMQQCYSDLVLCKATSQGCTPLVLPASDTCNCGLLVERLKARVEFVESNFTQTTQRMRMEMDQIAKERDMINLEAIHLRRDKSTQEKELMFFKIKTKDEFSQSLSGVSNVSKAFIEKIESLFPSHIPFQLTCNKQREHLEQIRTNCTSLSREVEDKLQGYLNIVGNQVSGIQAENNHLKAENWRLSEDYRSCTQNRSGLIQVYKQNLDKLQRKHDQEKEKLLVDKMRLNGEIDVLDNNVKYKTKEVDHLKEQIKHLNMTCMPKPGFGTSSRAGTGWGMFGGGGSSSASTGVGSLGRPVSGGLGSSYGSSGSAFNRAGSTGTGASSSSFLSPGSSSSLGSGLNKLGSTGAGSSSSSFLSPGSSSSLGSTGSGINKLGSTGAGSSSSSFLSPGSSSSLGSFGSGINKLGSTGTGSLGSSFLSPGSSTNLGSTGSGLNKLGSTGTGSLGSSFLSPGSSTNLGSTGSGLNKLGSTGTGSSSSSFLSPGSSTNLGSTGSGLNKLGTTGGSFGSLGSSPSLGSSAIGANKPAQSPKSSSTIGSSSGSAGLFPSLSSSGIGSNKPTSNAKSSIGSTSKTASTNSFSWLGFGNSPSGQGKTGTGTGKGTSSGTGSAFGAGRSTGLGGSSVNIAQHLQDLQRIINPSGPEEKQDLSRMLG